MLQAFNKKNLISCDYKMLVCRLSLIGGQNSCHKKRSVNNCCRMHGSSGWMTSFVRIHKAMMNCDHRYRDPAVGRDYKILNSGKT